MEWCQQKWGGGVGRSKDLSLQRNIFFFLAKTVRINFTKTLEKVKSVQHQAEQWIKEKENQNQNQEEIFTEFLLILFLLPSQLSSGENSSLLVWGFDPQCKGSHADFILKNFMFVCPILSGATWSTNARHLPWFCLVKTTHSEWKTEDIVQDVRQTNPTASLCKKSRMRHVTDCLKPGR